MTSRDLPSNVTVRKRAQARKSSPQKYHISAAQTMDVEEALHLVFGEGLDGLDSGEETDIEEDPDFPLPEHSDSECSEPGADDIQSSDTEGRN